MRYAIILLAAATSVAAQKPTVHQLPATPTTVAYGYYWSQARPATQTIHFGAGHPSRVVVPVIPR